MDDDERDALYRALDEEAVAAEKAITDHIETNGLEPQGVES